MPTLNRLFFASSILLIAVTVWMTWQDYDRNWKHFQRDFNELALKKAEKERADIESALKNSERGQELSALREQLKSAESVVEQKKKSIDEINEKREKNRGPMEKAVQEFQFDKSEADTFKFKAEKSAVDYEHAKKHAEELKGKDGAAHAEAVLPGLKKDMDAAELRFEEKNKETIEAKKEWEKFDAIDRGFAAEIAVILKDTVEVGKQIAKIETDLDAKKRQIAKLEPSLAKLLLNAPGMDFVAPTEKIDQNILPHFLEDVNFESSVFKIDRCTTCHLAISKSKGWTKSDLPEGTSPAFFSHPNLDLYVGDNSPHPISKFGCTICHNGQGRSVDFIYAAHTPKNAEQEKKWEEKYSWKPVAHYDTPMLPTPYVEASCTKCHSTQHRVTMADKLNEGKRLLETVGCYGCHPIAGTEDLRKPGPSLYGLKYKVTKDWAYNWIADPTQFRPTTKMPRPFYTSPALNEKEKADVEKRNQAMIQGIVEYLWENENLPGVPKAGYPAPPAGDVAKGKQLVEAVGCIACHVLDKPEEKGDQYRSFGPNLAGVGSKLNPGWTYAWLKDPSQYFHATNMPNLRLSDQEAADATAYLLSLKHHDKFEDRKSPPVDEAVLERTIIDFKKGAMSMAQAEKEAKELSPQGKLLWLGEKAIGQMGCFGCHDVKKFEKTKKIGAELTGSNSTGTKDITKFDFGFRHDLQHGHHPLSNDKINWVRAKLADPRTYDGGRIMAYEDRLRMPKFNLTQDDIEALTTYVLSFRREVVNPLYKRNMSNEDTVIDRGKRLVTLSNCASCHKTGVWPTRVAVTGSVDGENNIGVINGMNIYAARNILNDGRQVDRISDEELAILKKKGIVILVKKGTWLKGRVVEDLLNNNIHEVIVYGENEGAIRYLVNISEKDNKAPPVIVGEGAKVNPEWLFSFLKAPTEIRPWLSGADDRGVVDPAKRGVRMPTFGFTDDEATLIVQHFSYLSGERTPFRYEPPLDPAAREKMLAKGKAVFDENKCASCHVVAGGKLTTDNPAPAFAKVAPRLQKDWFGPWIRDPQAFAPGVGMTSYNEVQIKPEDEDSLREYIWSLHGK
ncbi:MAG: c-type cytochrome [Planctomycetota bacterium]